MKKDMENSANINNENVNILLKFINDTKDGKFSSSIPGIHIAFQRFEIQDSESTPIEEVEEKNEVILFGVS